MISQAGTWAGKGIRASPDSSLSGREGRPISAPRVRPTNLVTLTRSVRLRSGLLEYSQVLALNTGARVGATGLNGSCPKSLAGFFFKEAELAVGLLFCVPALFLLVVDKGLRAWCDRSVPWLPRQRQQTQVLSYLPEPAEMLKLQCSPIEIQWRWNMSHICNLKIF